LLTCGQFNLDLTNPIVMGILNTTPDSFSDGGQFQVVDQAVKYALQMEADGAAIIDIGGESTRPGADDVSLQLELDRVIPIIEKLSSILSIPISIDTSKPEVMKEAVSAGAGMVNDVMALQLDDSEAVLAELDDSIAICLMHMQGLPRTMQQAPSYNDVLNDVISFLKERVESCAEKGISKQRLIIDPGFGFGKKLEHNLTLLANLEYFNKMNLPILVGLSRKSMLGAILNDAPVDKRLFASVTAAVLAFERGAQIIRVHDVKETVEALKVAQAVMSYT